MVTAEDTGKILAYGEICDPCLGRFFGKRSFGLANRERGRALRIAHALAENIPFREQSGTCWVCGGLLDEVATWADRAAGAVSGIEFGTFLVGTRVPPLIAENEEMVWSDLSLRDPEPLKSEMNREVGKAVSARLGKTVDLKHPDVVLLLEIAKGEAGVQITPVFFRGRYRKFERGIPQTHWDCRSCQGRGCEKCNFTGKQYMDSVEELIGRTVTEVFSAEGAVLHGSGREDIDARMVGTGRPFIMEVVSPRVRTADLRDLEKAINERASGRIEVELEGWSGRDAVEIIKSNKAHKKYRILVEIEGPISHEELGKALSALNGAQIEQRTPTRVSHRRADLVRPRKVLGIGLIREEDGLFVLEVTGESGLYIKELISGDNGRTRPSLAGLLGRPACVRSLDVVAVE